LFGFNSHSNECACDASVRAGAREPSGAALAAIGMYFSRRQHGFDDSFRARHSMAWLPVGLSLMAALNSGIAYLMQPASTIRYGVTFH
jgi:Na+/proline symporter